MLEKKISNYILVKKTKELAVDDISAGIDKLFPANNAGKTIKDIQPFAFSYKIAMDPEEKKRFPADKKFTVLYNYATYSVRFTGSSTNDDWLTVWVMNGGFPMKKIEKL